MKLRFLGFKVKDVINPEKMTLCRLVLSQYGGTTVNWRHDHLVEVGVDRGDGGELDHAGLAAVGRVADEAVADQTHACTVQTVHCTAQYKQDNTSHPGHIIGMGIMWGYGQYVKLKHHQSYFCSRGSGWGGIAGGQRKKIHTSRC